MEPFSGIPERGKKIDNYYNRRKWAEKKCKEVKASTDGGLLRAIDLRFNYSDQVLVRARLRGESLNKRNESSPAESGLLDSENGGDCAAEGSLRTNGADCARKYGGGSSTKHQVECHFSANFLGLKLRVLGDDARVLQRGF